MGCNVFLRRCGWFWKLICALCDDRKVGQTGKPATWGDRDPLAKALERCQRAEKEAWREAHISVNPYLWDEGTVGRLLQLVAAVSVVVVVVTVEGRFSPSTPEDCVTNSQQ